MDIKKLHKGVVVRQALSGRRQVRLSFVPDDSSQTIESVILRNYEVDKETWRRFLGDDHTAVDIDTGVLVVRLNRDRSGGTAFFISSTDQSTPITNSFRENQSTGGVTISPRQFYACIAGKRREARAARVQYDPLTAVSECAPLFWAPE